MGLYERDDCDVIGVGDTDDPDIPDPARHPAEVAAAAAANDDPGSKPAWSEIPPSGWPPPPPNPPPPPPGEGGRSNGESLEGVDCGEALRWWWWPAALAEAAAAAADIAATAETAVMGFEAAEDVAEDAVLPPLLPSFFPFSLQSR